MNLEELFLKASYINQEFPENGIRKNYFLAACQIFSENTMTVDILEVLLRAPYGGLIGRDNSPLDRILSRSKVLRLHAVIHDAAGYMKSSHNIGPGYCYMLGNCPINCCFLGHVTGIAFCLYSKSFNPSYSRLQC
jgi:hypothetical protein